MSDGCRTLEVSPSCKKRKKKKEVLLWVTSEFLGRNNKKEEKKKNRGVVSPSQLQPPYSSSLINSISLNKRLHPYL